MACVRANASMWKSVCNSIYSESHIEMCIKYMQSSFEVPQVKYLHATCSSMHTLNRIKFILPTFVIWRQMINAIEFCATTAIKNNIFISSIFVNVIQFLLKCFDKIQLHLVANCHWQSHTRTKKTTSPVRQYIETVFHCQNSYSNHFFNTPINISKIYISTTICSDRRMWTFNENSVLIFLYLIWNIEMCWKMK